MYSNSCSSCSFEREIIKIGLSSDKMYSKRLLNVQESTTISNAFTKKVWKLIEGTSHTDAHTHTHTHIYIYIYIYIICTFGDRYQGRPKDSLFNCYNTEGQGRAGQGANPFRGLLHFTLDHYLNMLGFKPSGIKFNFLKKCGMTRPGFLEYFYVFGYVLIVIHYFHVWPFPGEKRWRRFVFFTQKKKCLNVF